MKKSPTLVSITEHPAKPAAGKPGTIPASEFLRRLSLEDAERPAQTLDKWTADYARKQLDAILGSADPIRAWQQAPKIPTGPKSPPASPTCSLPPQVTQPPASL